MRKYAILGVLLLAGCMGDQAPTSEDFGMTEQPLGAVTSPRVHKIKQGEKEIPIAVSPTGLNGIDYHGGPVILGTTNIYYIWYGNWSGNTATSILPDLAKNIGGSPYFAINTSYYNGSGTLVSNSVRYAGSTTDNYSHSTNLSDGDIWAIVSSAISSGRLPRDSNAVYFVLTSSDVTASSGFCATYCGWHNHGSLSGADIKYSFVGNPDRCLDTCAEQRMGPNGNAGADGMASVIVHELEEAVTDPDLNAWYDSIGNENADKCAWTFGIQYTTGNGARANMRLGNRDFLIQQNWVNANGGYCALSYQSNVLAMQRWATQQGGFWDTQQWVSGDFNGDGKTDTAKAFDEAGLASLDVHLSTGNGFVMQRWATQQGGFWDTQKWMAGDFNGDGRTDMAKVFNDGGLASIDVHLSTGNGFVMQRWATRQGGFWDAQKWMVGDFNGDGRADMAKVFNEGGLASMDVHLSTGSSFVMQRWATQQGGFWDTQKWMAGDLNGDGRADMVNVFDDAGLASIDVHLSTGNNFVMQRWATQQGGFWDTQKWMVGDFNGDGRADVAKAFGDNGLASIDVHLSTVNGFVMQRWATQQGGYWDAQKWMAGDFNGNHLGDLGKVFDDSGLGTIDVHIH